jgi:ABC-type antimicrobial peptide transport system permease subunit
MRIIDLLGMCLRNLFKRKIRTFLTLLGVLIGTTSITVMMSIGVGMDESFKLQLSRMGSINTITVDPYYMPPMEGNSMVMFSSSAERTLDDEAVRNITAIKGVEAVSPEMRAYLKVAAGRNIAGVDMIGIDPEKMELFDYDIQEGRLLTSEDKGGIIFGSRASQMFYNPREMGGRGGYYVVMPSDESSINLLQEKLIMTFDMSYGERMPMSFSEQNPRQYKTYKAEGVGILRESGERDYSAFMNINYLKKMIQDNERVERSMGGGRQSSKRGYDRILVKVKNINDIEDIQKKINELGYGAYSLADIRKQMQKSLGIVQAVLGAIGAVSLLVAALGITNTMYMSIYERTREIGIIKVLGCYLSDVRKIFLTEAGLIGFFGGVLGILLSFGISFVINVISSGFMNSMIDPMSAESKVPGISIIPAWLALFAILFAVMIGLISGYFPSRRAMKLSALEAIRTE